MGDPAVADETLIPPAVGFDDPDYLLGCGTLDYDAEARLISDNLLDFSHVTYVHANSFGSVDDYAKSPPKLTPLPRGVRFERWMVNNVGPGKSPDAERFDVWRTYDFLIPGVLLMYGASFSPGNGCRLQRPRA